MFITRISERADFNEQAPSLFKCCIITRDIKELRFLFYFVLNFIKYRDFYLYLKYITVYAFRLQFIKFFNKGSLLAD